MSMASPEIQDLSRRLLAIEAARDNSSGADAEVAMRVVEELRLRLIRLAGVDNALRHSIRQVFKLRVAAGVGERQHGQRINRLARSALLRAELLCLIEEQSGRWGQRVRRS